MSSYDAWKTRSDMDDWAAQNREAEDEPEELFSVCQFFDGGAHEYVRRDVRAVEAAHAAYHYTHNVASKLGLVERVMITDQGDHCVFLWERGKGIVFPEDPRMLAERMWGH